MKPFRRFILESPSKLSSEVYYHGSHIPGLKRFRTPDERPQDDPDYGQHNVGIYFTDRPEFARNFGPYVYQVKLNFTKPLDLTNVHNYVELVNLLPINQKDQHEARMTGIVSHLNDFKMGCYRAIEILDEKFNIIARLRQQGYNALVFRDWENGVHAITTVVFDPEQVQIIKMTNEKKPD